MDSKTMGPKPWVQNDESKTNGVDYSRSLTKSLFYFIWLIGYIYIYSFSWKKKRKSQTKNHVTKTMSSKP